MPAGVRLLEAMNGVCSGKSTPIQAAAAFSEALKHVTQVWAKVWKCVLAGYDEGGEQQDALCPGSRGTPAETYFVYDTSVLPQYTIRACCLAVFLLGSSIVARPC